MEKPLEIVVTTNDNRIVIENVLEILIKPHEGGMELRQNNDGWDLRPREVKDETEKVQMEREEVCQQPGSGGLICWIRRWACAHGLLVDLDSVEGGNNGEN